jgi:hypothetical protein
MKPIDYSATRRKFIKDTALGVAGISLMSSLGARTSSAQETKHGHLIKKISYNKDGWKTVGPANNDYIWWPKGKDLENKSINFSFGYYSKIGNWNRSTGGHYHPESDEVLIYVGLDPNNPEYLGAECEHDCGKEYEKHVFQVPTAFCIPKDVVHCPQFTLKCEKDFGFIVLGLDPTHASKAMPARSILATTDGHKYDDYYKKLVFQKGIAAKTGPGNADTLAWHRGKDLLNFNVNFAWGYFSGVGDWGAKPHKHSADKFLVFVGLDSQNPDYLGAEVEVSLEDEKHVFSTPSCVIVPAGLQHGPIVTKKVDKPYAFYMIRLDKGDATEINPA